MRTLTTILALLLAAGTGAAAAPAAAAVPCNASCQAQLQQQAADALPRTSFYDPPRPLPWAPPGSLIRQAESSGYEVDGAPVRATRPTATSP